LGILQNPDVSESAPVEAQANGKEVWINKRPTNDHQCSDWQRTLSDDETLTDSYSIISHKDRKVPNTIRQLLTHVIAILGFHVTSEKAKIKNF